MAGQAPWVELILPICFRGSQGWQGHVAGARGPTRMESLASMLKVNTADCGFPQGLGGTTEDLTTN